MNLQRVLAASLAVAVGIMLAFGAGASSQAHAQEDDPQTVVETFFDELNAADVDAAAALLADGFIFTDIDGGSFAIVGKEAFVSVVLEGLPEEDFQADIRSISAEGNTVTGVIAFSDSTGTVEAGIDRYLQPFVITVNDAGLIARGDFTYDEDDAQTRDYLEYQAGQEGPGEPPPGAVIVALAAQPGGNQPGQAIIFEDPEAPGVTFVAIEVTPGAGGVQQPAHFHTGTCAAPGPIVEPLANVLDGNSATLLSAPMSELVDQGLIINVHLSAAQPGSYVSCGEVRTAAAQPTPVPAQPTPAPAQPTPTRPAGVTAPDTGAGGGDGSGGGPSALLFTLAAIGAVAAGFGGLRLVLARMR
jgi:hypothetical protein